MGSANERRGWSRTPNDPCKHNNNFIPGYLVDYTGDINIPFILFGCLHAAGGITILIIPVQLERRRPLVNAKEIYSWRTMLDIIEFTYSFM